MIPSERKYNFCAKVFKHQNEDFSFSYANFFSFLALAEKGTLNNR